ncbi:hypothetical protein BC941DRAFT_473205 [Chlamydoabsidia padenii]|nr:hypothetical protein BC941DRAFT_473205 [Chlamydoabsidia padenii]
MLELILASNQPITKSMTIVIMSFIFAKAGFLNMDQQKHFLTTGHHIKSLGVWRCGWGSDDTREAVATRGTSYTLFFSLFGHLLRWSYGYQLIRKHEGDDDDDDTEEKFTSSPLDPTITTESSLEEHHAPSSSSSFNSSIKTLQTTINWAGIPGTDRRTYATTQTSTLR